MATQSVSVAAKILIFGTGPLWEDILFHAVKKEKIASLGPELRHVTDDARFERLECFIFRFQKRTTTLHVIAEISGRIIRTKPKQNEEGRQRIWRIAYKLLVDMKMDEEIIRISTMPLELVARVGAVDVSVLRLGSNLIPNRPRIFTVEDRLAAECSSAGLKAVVLSHLLAADDPLVYTVD